MSYLGKISAIVSANTSDFSAKLMASGKEVQSWARALNSAVNSASSKASSSLRGIYTEAQKTERALQAIQAGKINFKGFEGQNLSAAVSRMQALVSATKGVNEPLNQAARSLEKLPIAMQGGFLEAMKRAQTQAERLAFEIDKIGSGQLISGSALEQKFQAIANRAQLTTEAVGRLKEAAAAVDGLSTGRELQFRNPEFAAEMARARGLQAQAAATPGGDFAGIVERQRAAADATAEAFARMEEAQLAIGGDVAGTTAEYQRQLGILRSIGTEIERSISATRSQARAFALLPATQRPRGQGLFGSQSGTDEERALARARALSAEYARLPQSAQAGLQGLAGIAARVANAVAEGTANANQLNQVLDRLSVGVTAGGIQAGRQDLAMQIGNSFLNILTPAEAAADTLDAHAQALGRRLGNTFLNILTPAEAAADTADAHLQSLRRQIGNTFLGIITPAEAAADTLEAHAQALGRRMGNTFLNILTPAEAAADTADAHLQSLRRQIGNTFLGIITPAEAAADTLDAHAQALGRRLGNTFLNILTQAEAAADTPEAYRARAASRFLPINMQESDVLSNQGVTTPLVGNMAPRARLLSRLGGEIEVARRQIRGLADPLTDYLGPEIDRITIQFQAMARDGIELDVEAARRLAREVAAITAAMNARRAAGQRFSESFGGAGVAGLGLGVDERSLRSIGSQVEFVQQRLSMLSAEVRGPVLIALQRFREAAQRLFDAGTIDTESGRAELAALRNDLTRTLAAAGGGSQRRIAADMARVGDVARGGMDRFNLGMQQAIFAVDDFFSVTGDFQQRVRAIGNNLTQLGFIVGGTTGLFVSLAASLTLQGAAALYKWVNAGRTAEDSTKALNDALARQKSLVEELRQAFESLGDSIARKAFSGPAQEARGFAKELDDIRKKQREARDQRSFALDEGVIRAQADVNVAQKRLSNATTRDKSVAAQRQLDEAETRLRRERLRVRSRREPTVGDVRSSVDSLFSDASRRNARLAAQRAVNPFDPGAQVRAQQIAMAEGEQLRQRVAGRLAGVNDPSRAREILRDEQRQAAARGDTRLVAQLEELINSLEAPIKRAADELAVKILEGSMKVAKSLEATQQLLDATLIPFSQTRAKADEAAAELTKIVEELKTAEDPARIAELQKQQAALEQQSAQYRSAAEVIRTFADTVKRISTDLVNAVEGETRSIADRARRDANRAGAADDRAGVFGDFGPNGERRREGDSFRDAQRARKRRDDAEKEARRAQDEAEFVRRKNEEERRRFEAGIAGDPQIQAERKRLEELQAVIDSKTATEEEKARAAEEKASIQRTQERRFEDSPEGQRARDRADEADRAAARRQEDFRQQDEYFRAGLRGRDLGLKPGVREAREAENGLLDINAARNEGLITRQQAQEQANRFAQEQMRGAAPAIFEMADAVQNAILQGPSRQALEATDVSTMEGQRELNRLLRGDDASKNANIVELEKQNQKLGEMVATLRQVANQMGIVVDL